MRKFNLLLVFCLVAALAFSQALPKTIVIGGQVTNFADKGIPGHPVTIISDSINHFNFFHYRTVKTDENGFYKDTIRIPDENLKINFYIHTQDCNNQYFNRTVFYNKDSTEYSVYFKICDSIMHSCIASFYAYPDTSNGGNPFTFRFISTSQGASITSYLWIFDNKEHSPEQSPLFTFDKPGKYNVCLKITSEENGKIICENSYCSVIIVNDVPPPPKCTAYFTYVMNTPDTLNGPIVQFLDESKSALKITHWYWTFGNNDYSYEQNPKHLLKPGYNNVCLTITSGVDSLSSCTSNYCQDIFIPGPIQCHSDFYFYQDTAVNTPNFFRFVDVSKGNITKWQWEFGDSAFSEDKDAEHQYKNPGKYNVCLTVSNDSMNCKDTFCKVVIVGGQPDKCKVGFVFFPDTAGISPPEEKVLKFLANASGNIVSYLWEFNDGSSSQEISPSHAFWPGYHDVCLTATIENNNTTCTAQFCQKIFVDSIMPPPPPPSGDCKSSFSYKIMESDSVILVNFTAYSNRNANLTYNWNFDDNTGIITTSEFSINHVYKSKGEFNVCLTTTSVIDTFNCTFTSCQKVKFDSIGPPPPPVDNCQSDFIYYIMNSDTAFIVSFTAMTNSNAKLTYNWTFGDGSDVLSTTEKTVHHVYNEKKDYTVCMTSTAVIDTFNCAYTTCHTLYDRSDSTYFGTISGQVFSGNTFADKGYVTASKMEPKPNSGISYYDVSQISIDGSYHFDKLPYGTYYVEAFLYDGSQFYKEFIPTYFGDTWNWANAISISVGDLSANDHKDIHLLKALHHKKGVGRISGHIFHGNWKSGKGSPVAEIEVLLFDNSNNMLDFTTTDASGYYDFPELEMGTYNVFAEIIGLETYPATVNLTESGSASDSNDFSVSSTDITPSIATGILNQNSITENRFSEVYPNPIQDIAKINADLKTASTVRINVLNHLGQNVYTLNKNLSAGSQIIEINTVGLTKGMYIIMINDNNSIITRRFVRVN